MNHKAFFLSIEAAVSLIALTLIILAPFPLQQPDLSELHLLQKQHDLLLVWQKERTGEEQMLADFALVFPALSGEIYFNGKKISIGPKKEYSVKTTASVMLLSDSLEPGELRLTVFH
ncbi:MAG: hypothetical protein V1494_06655 [Candidatus Diapherotrites archaeon]